MFHFTYYWGDHIQEDEMGRTCSMYENIRNTEGFQNQVKREEMTWRPRSGWDVGRVQQTASVGSYECGNKYWGATKRPGFPEKDHAQLN